MQTVIAVAELMSFWKIKFPILSGETNTCFPFYKFSENIERAISK